jgi:hypothetical protein
MEHKILLCFTTLSMTNYEGTASAYACKKSDIFQLAYLASGPRI